MAIQSIEQACMALQGGDTQTAMMQLNLALNQLGGGTQGGAQGNMTGTTGGNATSMTTGGGGGAATGGGTTGGAAGPQVMP
jgi:hypothetical protein